MHEEPKNSSLHIESLLNYNVLHVNRTFSFCGGAEILSLTTRTESNQTFITCLLGKAPPKTIPILSSRELTRTDTTGQPSTVKRLPLVKHLKPES